MNRDRAIGSLVGLAVGDALGTTNEFKPRDTFPEVKGMVGGGCFNLAPGEWTDDTSMALALADSIIAVKGFDATDLLTRFCDWYENGKYSHNGRCFDIGTTTSTALDEFIDSGNSEPALNYHWLAGNGSIMRLAPAAIAWHRNLDDAIMFSDLQGKTTHAAEPARDCCRELSEMLWKLMHEVPLEEVMDLAELKATKRSMISSSGYSISTLNAAKWCVANTICFEDAVLRAANLGDDADTVAAVTGQLAGALYGYTAIPKEWLDVLAWHNQIVDTANNLIDLDL